MGSSIRIVVLVVSLCLDPEFELPDGLALYRQLDVGVDGIHILSRGVAHERPSHILDHACLHQPGIKAVSQLMEEKVTREGSLNEMVPCGFVIGFASAFVGKDAADTLSHRKQSL